MAGTRDIRSFFGGAPAKKKQKVEDASNTDTSKGGNSEAHGGAANEESTVKAEDSDAAVGKPNAAGDDEKEISEKSVEITVGAVADQDSPLTHSFQNLRRNVKVLMHASWYEQLEKEFARPYFTALTKFLEKEANRCVCVCALLKWHVSQFPSLLSCARPYRYLRYFLCSKKTIYPPPQDVFSSLRDCSFSSLKVVILGQDPYHGPEQAHGLSFSVRRGIPPPPSLKNIYKEAMSDVKISKPVHGCLSSWSQQGVLLLNTVLTVRKGEPNSHKKQGWETLTDAIIQRINANTSNVVFLLWGKPAQEKGAIINTKKHLVIRSSHPSPLGATKTNAPFIGSKCFSKTNEYLVAHGKDPIDWNVL